MAITPTSNDDVWPGDNVATEEIGVRCGVAPIRSTAELIELAHPELWNSDADFYAFLADLYAARRADIGLS